VLAPPICSMKLTLLSAIRRIATSLRLLVSGGTPEAVSLSRVGRQLISRAVMFQVNDEVLDLR
jgi:hypothetical protein